MKQTNFKAEIQKQKAHLKIYAILVSVLVLIVGFYTFKQVERYQIATQAIEFSQVSIDQLTSEIVEEESSYNAIKSEFDALYSEINKALSVVFPEKNSLTMITRHIDEIEQELARKDNIFEISNINYQAVLEEAEFMILPFRMNIRSSEENFIKFLHIIENSGSLEEKVRLMEVSSIKLNLPTTNEAEEENIISFTVKINAYFQKLDD
jgi:hypothetical protein